MARHNERCRGCKRSFAELLSMTFGRVEINHDLHLPCHLRDFMGAPFYETIANVHESLATYRGHAAFVRAARLPRVDYFASEARVVVEFDESQHFTRPRDLSLAHYAPDSRFGFDVPRWQSLCLKLDIRDNSPPDRDEQRAWYDTLRDFAPALLGAGPTIRVFSRDLVWCALDRRRRDDVATFLNTIKAGGAA